MHILIYKPFRITLVVLLLIGYLSNASGNVFVNPKSNHLNFYLGNFEPDEEAGVLEGPSSDIAIGFSHSQQSRHHPYFAADLEIWYLASEYRNTLAPPLLISPSDDMELESAAITIGARLMYPYDAPYRFYFSGGYGYFYSKLIVNANLQGTPGYYEDTSHEFAPYIGTGLTFDLGHRQTIEFFYRKWDFEGDFSRFNIPETNLGGEAYGIGFGIYW